MPIEEFLHPAGVKVHAGKTGLAYTNVGQIRIQNAAIHGVDQNLWAVLKIAVDTLRIAINVNSIDTGGHAANSRHYRGLAVDINRIGTPGGAMLQATLANPQAMRLVELLREHGFGIGEGRPRPGIIFGPVHTRLNPTGINHATHLHVSLPRV